MGRDNQELGPQERGRIAPGSGLTVREQAALYHQMMGLDATKRQARLRRQFVTDEREHRRTFGPK
jgi:signal recognition particle GTPase